MMWGDGVDVGGDVDGGDGSDGGLIGDSWASLPVVKLI